MPPPLNSLPTFARVRIEVKHNKITAITKSFVYWYIPNSHESIWYPFEMVYLIRASALLGSQSPSQRIPWLCLPLRAFKPNVTTALQKKGSNYNHRKHDCTISILMYSHKTIREHLKRVLYSKGVKECHESYPVLLKNWFNSSHLLMDKHPLVSPNKPFLIFWNGWQGFPGFPTS